MQQNDGVSFSNISASTAAFVLKGGRYGVCVMGSNYGTVKLQMVAGDGSTYVDCKQAFDKPDGTGGTEEDLVIGTFAANGMKILDLPPGLYRFTISSVTGAYLTASKLPT